MKMSFLKRSLTLFIAALLAGSTFVKADEGMWLPLFIKRLNIEDMQKMGLKLTAEEIYSVNNSSLKDAVGQLGGFCTAEVISPEGLVLTNHHCAFESIQSHSAVGKDYLTDGFWAMTKEQELPNPGLFISFVVRMEDVTKEVAANLSDTMSLAARNAAVKKTSEEIARKATEGTHYTARVRSFYDDNEFYLFVYETFNDIRLVGAPPSSIGKFGGDTDNWMWPRHTGDFAMFRIYAGKDGKPAAYSKDNVPYKPKHFLPVSLKGVKKDDFAMVMGFPGRTNRYLTSHGVSLAIEKEQPARVKIREKRLELMKEDMDASDEVRIKYASKYAQVSNYWKYFIGQTAGLKRLGVHAKKKQIEDEFANWIAMDKARGEKYSLVLPNFTAAYQTLDTYTLSQVYLQEALLGSEILSYALQMMPLYQTMKAQPDNKEAIKATADVIRQDMKDHFKDYNMATDKKVTEAMLQLFAEDVSVSQQPEIFNTIRTKYKGDVKKFTDEIFSKSVLADSTRLAKFLANPTLKGLENDPAFKTMYSALTNYRSNIAVKTAQSQEQLATAKRQFFAGLREMYADKKFSPDANSTLRLTYGRVLDYYPRDAVHYEYFTTLEGIMEKEDPNNDEFIVPQKLKELYRNKDYGQYADADGKLHVNFISNNDITGGNSGSPVINGEGHLIGCAFDGNWEAMSGDIAFEPELQRTISVDVRYILFIIDKYAGAGHLVKEMKLIK